jgi:single-strand DNA-binding protein
VADLRLAVSEKFKNRQGELVEKPVFVDVVVWDRQAENCAKYLSKGSPVLVEGRLQLDEWTSKEGEKRSKLRVRANTVQFLGKPDSDSRRTSSRSEPAPASDSFPPDESGEETPF